MLLNPILNVLIVLTLASLALGVPQLFPVYQNRTNGNSQLMSLTFDPCSCFINTYYCSMTRNGSTLRQCYDDTMLCSTKCGGPDINGNEGLLLPVVALKDVLVDVAVTSNSSNSTLEKRDCLGVCTANRDYCASNAGEYPDQLGSYINVCNYFFDTCVTKACGLLAQVSPMSRDVGTGSSAGLAERATCSEGCSSTWNTCAIWAATYFPRDELNEHIYVCNYYYQHCRINNCGLPAGLPPGYDYENVGPPDARIKGRSDVDKLEKRVTCDDCLGLWTFCIQLATHREDHPYYQCEEWLAQCQPGCTKKRDLSLPGTVNLQSRDSGLLKKRDCIDDCKTKNDVCDKYAEYWVGLIASGKLGSDVELPDGMSKSQAIYQMKLDCTGYYNACVMQCA